MSNPSDADLTQTGLPLDRKGGKILLVACGALAREVLEIIKINDWSHIDLTCLPAILHNSPDRIPSAIEKIVVQHKDVYDEIFVLYADCGTGGELFDLCKKLGVEMLKGPHCYSFYEGNLEFAKHTDTEISAFYLTDFLVRQFDSFVWKPLGLDRYPELRDAYFGNYTKLVYQAQTESADLDEKAEECADRLGLAYERRFTGYGDLQKSMYNWVN